jgi:hypothetical protein
MAISRCELSAGESTRHHEMETIIMSDKVRREFENGLSAAGVSLSATELKSG